MKPLRIYIAGALSSEENTERNPSEIVCDYIANLHKMCLVASKVRRLGHYPYIPGIDFLVGIVAGDWIEEDYRGGNDGFLEICDAILIISMSWGVKKELEHASELGLTIYNNVRDIPSVKE